MPLGQLLPLLAAPLLVHAGLAGPIAHPQQARASNWPDFAPGAVYAACSGNAPGIYQIGAQHCSLLFPMTSVGNQDIQGVFTFDSFSGRLLIWGGTAPSPNSNAIYAVDAKGNHLRLDLPGGVTANLLACDGRGRTYLDVNGNLWYFDGLQSNPTLVPLVDSNGVQFNYGPYHPRIKLIYDPHLSALVCAYFDQRSGTLPGTVGIHVLPLSASGDTYASQGVATVFPHGVNEQRPHGLSSKLGSGYCLATTDSGEVRFHDMRIDPFTLVASFTSEACFGQAFISPKGVTWHWRSGRPLVIARVINTSGVLAGVYFPPATCPGVGNGRILGCFPPDVLGNAALETIPAF